MKILSGRLFRVTLAASVVVGLLPAAASDVSAEVTPQNPDRVLDTRNGTGARRGMLRPGETLRLAVPGAPSPGTLALNLTAVDAPRDGHVIAWPCQRPKPATSSLNFAPGRAVANFAVLGYTSAGLCLSASQPVHLIADVMATLTGSDDFRSTAPHRHVDTRKTDARMRAGTVRRITIGGAGGIPAAAPAAAVNFTVVAPAETGYVFAFPCGASTNPPKSSTLNFGAGQTVAGFALTALSNGDVCVYSRVDAHLVVDSFGWMPAGSDVVVAHPKRILDTRNGTGGADGALGSGATLRLRVAGRGGVPNTASAAVLTVTGVGARSHGYVSAWPCDAKMPVASVLNTAPGAARANATLVRIGASGEVCLRAKASGGTPLHLVVDAVGWVPGSVNRPPPPPETPPPGRFRTLPVGASLPSGAECARLVRPAAEIRPGNTTANRTRGTRANGRYPRADGNFVGTTDEILQWVACKWGIDEDIVRAQTALESWWHQSNGGDHSYDKSACHPDLRGPTPCPESIGLLQVRYLYHQEAFVDSNAIRSSAYNADYTYAAWRSCFEGREGWLNTVERGATYGPGDAWGCLGVWYSGRWHTAAAEGYIDRVQDYRSQRIWETSGFRNG